MSEIVGYDFDTVSADGTDNLTQTILKLLNQYPKLATGQKIEFQYLDTTKGIAIFPNANVAILAQKKSVTGHVRQTCAYAFNLVYRSRKQSGTDKIKEWLDDLGRWLEQATYPALSGDRFFEEIKRTSQSYLSNITDDKAEDWVIPIQVTYRNEFDL